jgi:soluble lytic murein transglycosylase
VSLAQPLRTNGLGTAVLSLLVAGPAAEAAGQTPPGAGPSGGTLTLHLDRSLPLSGVRDDALEALETAVREWNDGDRLRGAVAADDALSRLPGLADWRPILFAELLVEAGEPEVVAAALTDVSRGSDLWSRWGWRVLVDAYEEAGDLPAARDAARTQARREPDRGRAAAAWLRAGELALQDGDLAGARADLWTALDLGPTLAPAQEAALLIDDEGWRGDGDGAEVRLGRALLAGREWAKAYARLAPFLEPGSPITLDDEVLVSLGRALVETRRYEQAKSLLAPFVEEDSGEDVSGEGLFWVGRAALGQGIGSEAEDAFRELATRYPESRRAEEGFVLLLERELQTGYGPRARGLLEELLAVGVRDAAAGTTIARLGTQEYFAGDYAEATRHFRSYLDGSRSAAGRQQAGYWAALALDRSGDPTAAQRLLEDVVAEDALSFYGGVAAERLELPVLPTALDAGPPSTPGLETQVGNAVLRLRVHRLVPTPGSFAFELDRLTRHFAAIPGGLYEFAERLIEGGLPLEAIVIGRSLRADEGSWNLRLLRIVHPFTHRDTVVRFAFERGLDPFFVAGLIRQESAFDAQIQSSSGAVGLMQLMPPTAREVAGSLGISYSPEILTDPATNLRLGTTYLASMVRSFGRPEDALAAYNAGPGRMRGWRGEETHGDRDVFIEHIPLDETRNYVKAVQGYARVYTMLYGCGDFEPCLGLSYSQATSANPLAIGLTGTERTLN